MKKPIITKEQRESMHNPELAIALAKLGRDICNTGIEEILHRALHAAADLLEMVNKEEKKDKP